MTSGGTTSGRTLDREYNQLLALRRPIEEMALNRDAFCRFTFSMRTGVTTPQSKALADEFLHLSAGQVYRNTPSVVTHRHTKTHRNLTGKVVAHTHSVTLSAAHEVLSDIARTDFGMSSAEFNRRCPSYYALDKRTITRTLTLALQPGETEQVRKLIEDALQSVSNAHGLTVKLTPAPWPVRLWLKLSGQEGLRISFNGMAMNIKAVLHATGLENEAIRHFTHQYA